MLCNRMLARKKRFEFFFTKFINSKNILLTNVGQLEKFLRSWPYFNCSVRLNSKKKNSFQISWFHDFANFVFQLSQAELQIEELQLLVDKLNDQNENKRTVNQSLLEDMLSVIQTYCDIEQKLDYQKFPIDDPEVHSFLENAKKAIDDLKIFYEREMELCRDSFNEERETLEQLLEAERGMVTHLESRLCDAEDTEILLTRETHNIQLSHKEVSFTNIFFF